MSFSGNAKISVGASNTDREKVIENMVLQGQDGTKNIDEIKDATKESLRILLVDSEELYRNSKEIEISVNGHLQWGDESDKYDNTIVNISVKEIIPPDPVPAPE